MTKSKTAEKEDEPGKDWGRVTAWMNKKNPNWKRVEANMRALAVKKARSARLDRLHEEEQRTMKLYVAVCKEAAEWSPIIAKDPTAIDRMPDTLDSGPFPSNKDLFELAASRRSPDPQWPPPPLFPSRSPSPSPSPSPSSNTKEKPFLPFKPSRESGLRLLRLRAPELFLDDPPPPQPRWKGKKRSRSESEEEIQGLNMILVAVLEEMRDRLPPESNPRRWFEAMLQYKPTS